MCSFCFDVQKCDPPIAASRQQTLFALRTSDKANLAVACAHSVSNFILIGFANLKTLKIVFYFEF